MTKSIPLTEVFEAGGRILKGETRRAARGDDSLRPRYNPGARARIQIKASKRQ
jgi:hypothetical protein